MSSAPAPSENRSSDSSRTTASAFGIDEVTFHKRTPLREERAKVADLIRRGASLAVDDEQGRWFP